MTYVVTTQAPIVEVSADLVGDWQPALVTVRGDGLEAFTQLTWRPVVVGRTSIHLSVTDACGRVGQTGLDRPVETR